MTDKKLFEIIAKKGSNHFLSCFVWALNKKQVEIYAKEKYSNMITEIQEVVDISSIKIQ